MYVGLQKLWRKNPASILSGLSHFFFHGEILEWIEREIDEKQPISLNRFNSSVQMIREAGIDCINDFNWMKKCGKEHIIKAITDLDGLSDFQSSNNTSNNKKFRSINNYEVREMLLSLSFKGLIVGPLRNQFKPLSEIGNDLGNDWKWCGGCKANDGRLFFLPRNAPEFKVLVFDPTFGTTKFLDLPKEKRMRGFPITGQKYNGMHINIIYTLFKNPIYIYPIFFIYPHI